VLAHPGQTVCWNGTGNGIERGAVRERNSRGRSFSVRQGCDVVREGELLFMNYPSDPLPPAV
jgi:type IV secretory pathway protease TraF